MSFNKLFFNGHWSEIKITVIRIERSTEKCNFPVLSEETNEVILSNGSFKIY